MKNIILLSFLLCTGFLFSCEKKNDVGNVSFTSKYDFNVSLPPQDTISVPETTLVVSSDISIDDVRLEKCKKASLKEFFIEIKDPSTQTFDFCTEVHLWLSAPGIPETDVISAVNINPNAKRIDFAVNTIELSQFLRKKTMTAKVKVVLKKGYIQPINLFGNLLFNVQTGLD